MNCNVAFFNAFSKLHPVIPIAHLQCACFTNISKRNLLDTAFASQIWNVNVGHFQNYTGHFTTRKTRSETTPQNKCFLALWQWSWPDMDKNTAKKKMSTRTAKALTWSCRWHLSVPTHVQTSQCGYVSKCLSPQKSKPAGLYACSNFNTHIHTQKRIELHTSAFRIHICTGIPTN